MVDPMATMMVGWTVHQRDLKLGGLLVAQLVMMMADPKDAMKISLAPPTLVGSKLVVELIWMVGWNLMVLLMKQEIVLEVHWLKS